jgi:hypothetical protein
MLFKLDPTEKTMRKTPVLALAIVSALMSLAIQQLHASFQPIDGVVTDTMCTKKHMMPGKSNALCVQECVKDGSSYALVAGAKVYTLIAKPQTIAPFAGKHVHIEGHFKASTITITLITETMPQGMKM